jgi:potassium-transporting ATPase KdpC subunit
MSAPPEPKRSDDGSAAPSGRAHSLATHVRATVLFLVLSLLMTGAAYPAVVTEVAHLIDPFAAGGSLLRNSAGTVIGSEEVAQNLTNHSQPWLFWARPSLTDYNMTLGADTPPGPTDPALRQLLNETIAYMKSFGNLTVNATLPAWLVSPSASDLDPDLVPEAVLVQIPRVANATDLSVGALLDLVNAHITQPILPGIGVPYVNVLELDLALLPMIGK